MTPPSNHPEHQGEEVAFPADSPGQLQALLTDDTFSSNNSEETLYRALKSALKDDPKAASRSYDTGGGDSKKQVFAIQLALQNRRSLLARGLIDEAEMMEFCTRLVFMNPSALLLKHEYKKGAGCTIEYQIFEPIVHWIVQAHFPTPAAVKNLRRYSRNMNSYPSTVDEYLKWEKSLLEKVESNGGKDYLHVEKFSPDFAVPITADADFLLRLLSNVMDNFDHSADTIDDDNSDHSKLPTQTIPGEPSVHEIIDTLKIHFAAIPAFIKTMLFCEDVDADKLFNLTFVKHVMLEKEYAGNWIKPLLKYHPDKALLYFNLLSRFLTTDVSGLVETSTDTLRRMEWKGEDVPNEVLIVHNQRDKFMDHMMKYHFTTIVHALSTSNSLAREAAKIPFVQRIVDQYAQQTFLLSQVAFDLIFYFFLTVGYQTMTVSFMIDYNQEIYLVSSEISVFSAVYFLLRKGTEFIAEVRNWTGFKKHILFNMWHWFEWASIILSILSHLRIDHDFAPDDFGVVPVSAYIRYLVATTTLFQLLHFVAYIRKANEDIAVFIVSLEKILYNVRWFFFILALTLATFAQMFIAVLSGELPPKPCAGDIKESPFDDYDDAVFQNCEIEYHYERVYQMMLGDWNSSDFGTTFSYSMFVLFSFFVTLILGNILVAIACDSYAEAKEDGPSIFRAERISLCASAASLEKYLSESVCSNRLTMGATFILLSAAIYVSAVSVQSVVELMPQLESDDDIDPNLLLWCSLGVIVSIVVNAWGVFIFTSLNNSRKSADVVRVKVFQKYFSWIGSMVAPLGRLYIGSPIEEEVSSTEENVAATSSGGDCQGSDGLSLDQIRKLLVSDDLFSRKFDRAHNDDSSNQISELKDMIAILLKQSSPKQL